MSGTDTQPSLLDAPEPASAVPSASPAPPRTGLVVHRCSRADRLADQLAEVLTVPLPDPFATEVVCVPTPGVERWLSQTLATRLGTSPGRGDGVCAGIDFVRLDRLLGQTVGDVLDLPLAADPWHGDRPVWGLLRALDDSLGEPWFESVRVGLGPQARNRFQSARRVARLFRRYAAQRPALLGAWRTGADTAPDGAPLDEFARWQPALWRGLIARIDGADPALRVAEVARRLAADPRLVDLPPRLSIFGVTRLSPEELTLIEALAAHREVHLFLPHPSPVLWSELAARDLTVGPREEDPTADLPGNRLLARLGRDARELQISLSGLDFRDAPTAEPERGETLLGRLQQAVVGNLDPDTDTGRRLRRTLAPDDHSVHFHACHGPDRQVEVLREVVLGLLADDPTLEPRDIIVMCPDIETFAPLIEAAFSLDGLDETAGHPGQRLRIRLADRALRQLNPLLGTLARLLELPVNRCGASELLDLCADPAVMRKFSFTDSELERLHDLVPASGIRWGLDAEHREIFAMQGFPQNTWRTGLQRMLLGVAMSEDDQPYRGTVTPLDDIDSSDVDLVGRLVELVTRLRTVVDSFSRAQPLSDWLTACREALTALTEVPSGERWQLAHAWGELADLADDAAPGIDADGEEPVLQPADLRALLSDAFAGRPSRANFRTGALTLCTMTPMRSVPHRVVCLLGLDDGVFPRRVHADGDDLLAAQPWIGDRDPRSEDRQVLLDAVLAATERLVLVHSGASPQTGEPRPASVPVTELREALHELLADPSEADALVTRHSLQPFDSSNFRSPRPFSFDTTMRAAALASATGAPSGSPVAPAAETLLLPPLPELTGDHVEIALSDLLSFFAHPAKAFLRRRAGLYPSDEEDEPQLDEMPLSLDGLQQWQIGDRLLRAHLAGTPLADLRMPELLRGELPPFQLGSGVLDQVAAEVVKIARAAEPHLGDTAESRWIDVDLGGTRITGLVPGIHGDKAVEVGFSAIKGKQQLRSWITLLVLRCSHPEVDWRSVCVGKGGRVNTLGPISTSDARARLSELVTLYAQGLREWLPLPPNTAAREVATSRTGGDPRPVRSAWDYEHDAAWGMFVGNYLDTLRAVPSTPADRTTVRSRFEALAHRVFEPLLDAEVRR